MGKRQRRRLLAWLAAALLWPAVAMAQISPTYTFVAGTVISPDEVNANFALLQNALNRAGGTMTGTLTSRDLTPASTATYDLGVTGTRYRNGWFSGTVTVPTIAISTLTCTACVSTTQLDSGLHYTQYDQAATITAAWTFSNGNGLRVLDSDSSHALVLTTSSNLTANHTLTLVPGNSDRTLTISGNATISQDYSTSGTPTFAGVTAGALQAFSTATAAGRALLSGTAPEYEFFDSDGSSGQKYWRMLWQSGGWQLQSIDDAYTTATTQFTVNVDGTVSYKTASVTSHNSRSAGTAYQAASDGIVTVLLDGETIGGGGTATIATDASNPPTTTRCAAAVLNNKQSCSTMVKKGDYYKVTVTTGSGTITPTIDWTPFGTAGGS